MVSTDISPNHFYYNRLVQTSTNTTVTVQPSSVGIPGFAMATAADLPIRIPIENPGEALALMLITDAASSVANYAQIEVRYANRTTDPGWAGKDYAVTSTVDGAFKVFCSTDVIGAVTASEAKAYTIILDTAPFACNFGGTSSAITDAYESFIEVYAGQSTKAGGNGHNAANAVISTGVGYFIGAMSVPR